MNTTATLPDPALPLLDLTFSIAVWNGYETIEHTYKTLAELAPVLSLMIPMVGVDGIGEPRVIAYTDAFDADTFTDLTYDAAGNIARATKGGSVIVLENPGSMSLKVLAGWMLEQYPTPGDGVTDADRVAAIVKDGHKHRVYVENQEADTYAYSCACGKRDGGYLHREYARDGWREAHGLAPLVNYPMV